MPASTLVAGTEVAVGIVGGAVFGREFFHLTLPGTLRAVGRDKGPLASQRIESFVRMLFEVEQCGLREVKPIRTRLSWNRISLS